MPIPFTQFMRPDGRQVPVEINMPEYVEDMAVTLINRGYRFEIEHLRTGNVSMTCEKYGGIGVHELCENNEEVPKTVQSLVEKAYALENTAGEEILE